MSDAKGANSDPSMDDILASIRKIISDDEARAQVDGEGANASASASRRDDVLLLTDLVEEPPELPPSPAMPLPASSPPVDPAIASEMPQPMVPPPPPAKPMTVVETLPPVEPLPPPAPPVPVSTPAPAEIASVTAMEPPVKQPTSDSLVDSGVAGVTASAFDRLSKAMQDNVPTPVAQDVGPAVGSRNLEDIVKEMLRPMLKEWLDKNLPPLVERYVEREIVRLTRR